MLQACADALFVQDRICGVFSCFCHSCVGPTCKPQRCKASRATPSKSYPLKMTKHICKARQQPGFCPPCLCNCVVGPQAGQLAMHWRGQPCMMHSSSCCMQTWHIYMECSPEQHACHAHPLNSTYYQNNMASAQSSFTTCSCRDTIKQWCPWSS